MSSNTSDLMADGVSLDGGPRRRGQSIKSTSPTEDTHEVVFTPRRKPPRPLISAPAPPASRSSTPGWYELEVVDWPQDCLECCARSHYPAPPFCDIRGPQMVKNGPAWKQPCGHCKANNRVCVAPVRGGEGYEAAISRLVREMRDESTNDEGAYLAIAWIAKMAGGWKELEEIVPTTDLKAYVAHIRTCEPKIQW